MEKDYYFAVFGDIHGRIALMYTLANLWQETQQISLDGILQVGDMGAFPNPNKLDKATAKFATHDPDELGFSHFCRTTEESTFYFGTNNQVKTYFIRGNHEDFDYLSSFKVPTGVDPWKRLWYIPDGQSIHLEKSQHRLCIAGFGGMAPRHNERKRGKKHRKEYRRGKQRALEEPQFFTTNAIENSFYDMLSTDILMTHGAPYSINSPYGSNLLSNLSNRLQPRIHFFGHHHVALAPCIIGNHCVLVGLEHLEFNKNSQLKEGAWGILKINPDKVEFSFCSSEKLQWINDITKESYRSVWQHSMET